MHFCGQKKNIPKMLNLTTSAVIQFVLYVMAFWGTWKILDGFLHISFLWSRKIDPSCTACLSNLELRHISERKNRALEAELAGALKDPCKEILHHARVLSKIIIEQKLVERLNTASEKDLKRLDGIGPQRAYSIISKRPYHCLNKHLRKNIKSVRDQDLYYWADPRWDRTNNLYQV